MRIIYIKKKKDKQTIQPDEILLYHSGCFNKLSKNLEEHNISLTKKACNYSLNCIRQNVSLALEPLTVVFF